MGNFYEGQVLTAESLNALATKEELKTRAENNNPVIMGSIRLQSVTGNNTFLLTTTDSGLEIQKEGATTPAVIVKNDGSLEYARKRLRIITLRNPSRTMSLNGQWTYALSDVGTYRVMDRGLLNSVISVYSSNTFQVKKENGAYYFQIYNSEGVAQGGWVKSNRTDGVEIFIISTCDVQYYTSNPVEFECVFDGSRDVTCDLTNIITKGISAMSAETASLEQPVSNEATKIVLNTTALPD